VREYHVLIDQPHDSMQCDNSSGSGRKNLQHMHCPVPVAARRDQEAFVLEVVARSFRSFAPRLPSAHLCLGLGLLFLLALQRLPLSGDSLLSPLAGSLGLCTLGVHLVLEDLLALLLGLGTVDLEYVSMDVRVYRLG
jgi:hypothetical protein